MGVKAKPWVGFSADCKTQVCRLPIDLWLKLYYLREVEEVAIMPILENDQQKEIESLKVILEEKDKLLYEVRQTLTLQREEIERLRNQAVPQRLNNIDHELPPHYDVPQYHDEPPPDFYECNGDLESEPPTSILESITKESEPVIKESKPTVLDALRYMAFDDKDRATEVNGRGFNKVDGEFGHDLAKKDSLSYGQATAIWRMLKKYAKTQLLPVGINLDSMKPERLQRVQAEMDWSNGKNPFSLIAGDAAQILENAYSHIESDELIDLKPDVTKLPASVTQVYDNADGLDHSPEFDEAIRSLNEGQSFFLTGKAGTGKTTLIKHWIETTDKNVAVVAPTGIAALNTGGVTVHSFFGLPPRMVMLDEIKRWSDSRRRKAVQEIDAVIVDESSMVSSPMLDNINMSLQKNRDNMDEAFGGVQAVFVGDLFQLPPIVSNRKDSRQGSVSEKELLRMWGYKSEYFFSAHTFEKGPLSTIELQKVYRQKDNTYLDILNRIRVGKMTRDDIAVLNRRVIPNFTPKDGEFYITLAPTNHLVAEANNNALKKLSGSSYFYKADIVDKFNPKDCPAEPELELREGAHVMFLANHPDGDYVNGTMGKVVELEEDRIYVDIEDGKEEHRVDKVEWKNEIYIWNSEKKKLEFEKIGSLKQFPIKLAYAATVHKSQGQQFERLIIGKGRFFAAGQAYVALSRCTSLAGLVLQQPFQMSDVIVDSRVIDFMN